MKTDTAILIVGALGAAFLLTQKSPESGSSYLPGVPAINLPSISYPSMPAINLPSISYPNISIPEIGGGLGLDDVVGIIDLTKDLNDAKVKFEEAIAAVTVNKDSGGFTGWLEEKLGSGTKETGTPESSEPRSFGEFTGLEGWGGMISGWNVSQLGQAAYDVSGLSPELLDKIQNTPGLDVLSGALPWQTPTGFGMMAPWRKTVSDETGKIITTEEALTRAYNAEEGRKSVSGVPEEGRESASGVAEGAGSNDNLTAFLRGIGFI